MATADTLSTAQFLGHIGDLAHAASRLPPPPPPMSADQLKRWRLRQAGHAYDAHDEAPDRD